MQRIFTIENQRKNASYPRLRKEAESNFEVNTNWLAVLIV